MKQLGLLQADKAGRSGHDFRSDGRGTQGVVTGLDVLPYSGHGRSDGLLIAGQDGVDHRRDIGAQAQILRHDGDAGRDLRDHNAEHRAVLQPFEAMTVPQAGVGTPAGPMTFELCSEGKHNNLL